MCYSAQIWQQYRRYVRAYDSKIDIETFVELFWSRLQDDRIKIPKALEEAFNSPDNEPERRIKRLLMTTKCSRPPSWLTCGAPS